MQKGVPIVFASQHRGGHAALESLFLSHVVCVVCRCMYLGEGKSRGREASVGGAFRHLRRGHSRAFAYVSRGHSAAFGGIRGHSPIRSLVCIWLFL